MNTWNSVLDAHLALAKAMRADEAFAKTLEETAARICEAVGRGGKVLLFGNGGSAADAQHIAAEFVGRFRLDRAAINAVALTTNTSVLTAVANDFDFTAVFARQVSALASPSDVVIGLSTGGFSKNVLAGLREAKRLGALTVLLAGESFDPACADIVIAVPSKDTPRIQEMHILIGHYLAEYVEKKQADARLSEEET